MPFVSQAQRAKFYATPALHKYIAEFESATHSKLPEHKRLAQKLAKKKKRHA